MRGGIGRDRRESLLSRSYWKSREFAWVMNSKVIGCVQCMGFLFGKGFSGQEWFQWIRGLSVHRKRVNECSKWLEAVRVRIPTILNRIF